MKHLHADNMLAYAQDAQETERPWERWQHRQSGNTIWHPITGHPQWDWNVEYERKPRTIRIGNYDVPEPLRVAPSEDAHYYTPNFGCHSGVADFFYTSHHDYDNITIKRGMMHLTKEAAELHAKALISLTEQAP